MKHVSLYKDIELRYEHYITGSKNPATVNFGNPISGGSENAEGEAPIAATGNVLGALASPGFSYLSRFENGMDFAL